MKRGRSTRGDQLTGGSGDVSPQWFQLSNVTLTAANTFNQGTTSIPVQRLAFGRGKSLVMELLKVEFTYPEWDSNPSAGGQIANAGMQLSTTSLAALDDSNPLVLAFRQQTWRGAFTAAGSYITVSTTPIVADLTDGAGHGVLFAGDTIYLGCNTTAFAGAATFSCRILYRWKEVSLEEYIGIVQSQQ